MFEIVYDDDDDDDGRRTTDDGRRLDGYTISSPCEPNGSGELTMKGSRWPSGSERSGVQYLPPPFCILKQRHIYSPESIGNAQNAVTPSHHD